MPKLTALGVKNAKSGRHGDGQGLYLMVKPTGGRSWVLRVQYRGRREDIGLGSLADLTLAEARDRAAELRKAARQGKSARVERDKGKSTAPTFSEAMKAAHKELAKGWSPKTGIAFLASLNDHAIPLLGHHRVDAIGTAEIKAVLKPIWTDKPHQARKVRHRILQVLSYARSEGWRSEVVPSGKDVREGLAKQPRARGFAAVPYGDIPKFVTGELGNAQTAARLALLFTILTAARSGEVRAACWEDIDLKARTWTRQAEAMKSRLVHVVTLSSAALAVLAKAEEYGKVGLIFPSTRRDRPLSDMTLAKVLRAAGRSETVHGFRSSFRDWAAEQMPTVPAMVAEMALAHSVGTATEQSYLRTDLRDQRHQLLEAWGQYAAPGLRLPDA